jgi:hypothetical protein
MKNIFYILICFTFIQCSTKLNNRLIISDFQKNKEFLIQSEPNSIIENIFNINPVGIKIKIKGKIKGSALILLNNYDSLVIESGKIDDSISQEFYSNQCTLKFIPLESSNGKLTLTYNFHKI